MGTGSKSVNLEHPIPTVLLFYVVLLCVLLDPTSRSSRRPESNSVLRVISPPHDARYGPQGAVTIIYFHGNVAWAPCCRGRMDVYVGGGGWSTWSAVMENTP